MFRDIVISATNSHVPLTTHNFTVLSGWACSVDYIGCGRLALITHVGAHVFCLTTCLCVGVLYV